MANRFVTGPPLIVVLISANIEWRVILTLFPDVTLQSSPLGQWFTAEVPVSQKEASQAATRQSLPVIFFHGGWGKIAAAASTQYVIDRWRPDLIFNLGTCGGFEGEIERGAIILVERTLVYDIIEQMGDYAEHIAHYTTQLDLSWLGDETPQEVRRSLLVSGDRDLLVEDIPELISRYGAVAGDWESGAIAFVAARNGTRLVILRGVTDLVGKSGGEAYGNISLFEAATVGILKRLVDALPLWIEKYLAYSLWKPDMG